MQVSLYKALLSEDVSEAYLTGKESRNGIRTLSYSFKRNLDGLPGTVIKDWIEHGTIMTCDELSSALPLQIMGRPQNKG